MNVLVIAAHPDDEVLGCGGTIARHASARDNVFIAILAEGMMSRSDGENNLGLRDKQKKLKDCSLKASRILGAKEVFFYGFPDNRMDGIDFLDVVLAVEECIRRVRPALIYTHHEGDLNIDHTITARAVITATRPLSKTFSPELYAFEVLSSSEWAFGSGSKQFQPNYFLGIEGYLDKKFEAMSIYESETSPYPHPRSVKAIKALSVRRGSQSGLGAAEAFMLLRKISR